MAKLMPAERNYKMLRCKMCVKARASLNEQGICHHCAQKLKGQATTVSFEPVTATKTIPYLTNGRILSKEAWLRIKRTIDAYYASVSVDEIDAYNDQVAQLRKAAGYKGRNPGYIYLMSSSVGSYKLGRATNVETRLKGHMRDYPVQIRVMHTIKVSDAVAAESVLLKAFKDKRLQGEWFELSDDDVRWVLSLTTESLERLVDEARKR